MAEKVIKTLMSDSHWAKDQTIASLTQALRNETDEFITSFELRDKLNVFSEAGDVLMILLCCLQHQFGATTEQMLPRVLDEIVQKLRRRFSHLYASSQKVGKPVQLPLFNDNAVTSTSKLPTSAGESRTSEDLLWSRSKKRETIEKYSFCNNPQCNHQYEVGTGNIVFTSDHKLKCTHCHTVDTISNRTLFSAKTTSRENILITTAKLFQEAHSPRVLFYGLSKQKRRKIRSWLLSSLQHERALCDILERRYGILTEETNSLMSDILQSVRLTVSETHEKTTLYHARGWDRQRAYRHVLIASQGRTIEAMTVYHYKGDILRDVTVEISNMKGCNVGCFFCAASELDEARPLSPIEYLAQVNTCLRLEKITPDTLPDFQVSFAGIGEPSSVAAKVLQGAECIRRVYPGVRFNIVLSLELFDQYSPR